MGGETMNTEREAVWATECVATETRVVGWVDVPAAVHEDALPISSGIPRVIGGEFDWEAHQAPPGVVWVVPPTKVASEPPATVPIPSAMWLVLGVLALFLAGRSLRRG